MNEMIDRVARVLSPQSWQALGTPCDTRAKKKRREASLDYAKRVVKAMREPTDYQRNKYYELSGKTEVMFDAHWERAIDSILK